MNECFYCSSYLYALDDGSLKCSNCKKKLSKNKINKIILFIQCYVLNESAHSVAKRNNLSYISVQKYYMTFRSLCAKISENEYEKIRHLECEFEEYHYLEKSKANKREAVFDAQNFLTFSYDSHIYTLLMPSLQQYKKQFLEDGMGRTHIKEFQKFKRDTKLIKISKRQNTIVVFWEYFENAILKYRGIKNDAFIYFLKEFEFKFNHTQEEMIDLLIKQYFKEN